MSLLSMVTVMVLFSPFFCFIYAVSPLSSLRYSARPCAVLTLVTLLNGCGYRFWQYFLLVLLSVRLHGAEGFTVPHVLLTIYLITFSLSFPSAMDSSGKFVQTHLSTSLLRCGPSPSNLTMIWAWTKPLAWYSQTYIPYSCLVNTLLFRSFSNSLKLNLKNAVH